MYPLDKTQQRAAAVLALGDQLAAHGGRALALQTLREGGDERVFMRKLQAQLSAEPTFAAADRLLGIEARDFEGYSISRAIRAAYNHNWADAGLERSISDLAVSRTGQAPNGTWVPFSALFRDFNADTANQAGNIITSTVANASQLDPIRKAMPLQRLGATVITGLRDGVVVPRFASSTAAGWKTEVAAATEVTETTGAVSLTPKRAPVVMRVSTQAFLTANPAELDTTIARHLTDALFELVTDAAANADGTSGAPTGIRSTSGIGSVVGGADGATLTFVHLADLEDKPALANIEEGASGWLINSKTRRYLRTLAQGSGLPYTWQGGPRPLLGHRAGVSNVMPSTLTKGSSGAVCSALIFSADWSHLLLGIFGAGVDIVVDRHTYADTAQLRIVASLLVDIGVTRPEAFSAMSDAKLA